MGTNLKHNNMNEVIFQNTNGDMQVTWTKTDKITPHAKRRGYKYMVHTLYVNSKTGKVMHEGVYYTKK
jgi:hypothetical protein